MDSFHNTKRCYVAAKGKINEQSYAAAVNPVNCNTVLHVGCKI